MRPGAWISMDRSVRMLLQTSLYMNLYNQCWYRINMILCGDSVYIMALCIPLFVYSTCQAAVEFASKFVQRKSVTSVSHTLEVLLVLFQNQNVLVLRCPATYFTKLITYAH